MISPLAPVAALGVLAAGAPDPDRAGPLTAPGHWWSLWPELFLAPGRLWWLLLVPVLLGLYLWRQRRRRRYALRFSAVPLLEGVADRRPGWRRHLVAAGLLVTLVVLVIGYARPAGQVREPRERATVVLAIDVSLSMAAADVPPGRLQVAREAARQFARDLPPGMNLGLVSFSGNASVLVPPTQDHQAVVEALDTLSLSEYTAIGEAIFVSLQAVNLAPRAPDGSPVPAHIVVLSDGETTVGRSNAEAVRAANAADVPVSTIAFGTSDGTVDINGEFVPVPVNEGQLRAIAEEAHGHAYRAGSLGELQQVYEDIGSSVGYVLVPAEITHRWLGLGLLFLVATVIGSLSWFGRLP